MRLSPAAPICAAQWLHFSRAQHLSGPRALRHIHRCGKWKRFFRTGVTRVRLLYRYLYQSRPIADRIYVICHRIAAITKRYVYARARSPQISNEFVIIAIEAYKRSAEITHLAWTIADSRKSGDEASGMMCMCDTRVGERNAL